MRWLTKFTKFMNSCKNYLDVKLQHLNKYSLGKEILRNFCVTYFFSIFSVYFEILFILVLLLLRKQTSKKDTLKVVSATFLLVCFLHLKESTSETRKNVFYFTSKALFVLEIIKF